MKNIYYLLLTLAISSLSFGQEVFNLPGGGTLPTGWTATNNVTSQPIEQSSYFLLDSGDPSDIIVSAVYDLSAYSSAEFNLDVATFGSGDNNSATIEISYDGGATYTSSETTAVPTSSSYIAGGTFAVTPSAQVVIKLTNTGVAGRGNRLRNLILTGAAAPAPLQITTSVCATATSVRMTGPWWEWNPVGGPEAVSNNDGTWTFTFDPAPTASMEYLLVVDGVQENLISITANGGTCAPVTDSASYANRQWILDSGDVTNNYGQCGTTCVAPVITLIGGDVTITVGDAYTDAGATASDDEQGDITSDILGITDLDTSVAGEYTVAYNVSDGALNAATEVVRTVTVEAAGPAPLQITTSVCATATSVRMTGPWWEWNPVGGPEAVSNNDGTWTFTFDPAPTASMEYLLVVDGVQENLISITANGGTCAPVTDSASYANRQWILDSGDVTNNYGQCGTTCVAPVITLIGGDVTITVGDAYTDAGATASDDEQGDITSDILGITDLDTSVAGEYTVAYNVSDGALNAATEVVRTVTVEAVPVCTASEGFETFPLVDWTLYSSNTSNGVTQSTTWANSGLNSLRFASFSTASTYDQYAVTPQLVTTSGDQTISFYYKSSNGSERFKVGTSSTGDDFVNDFTWSDEIVSSTTAAQYSISDLPVGTTYVAIHYYSNYQYYMYVDDFCMPELYVPDCVAPTALDVADVTTTTASVTWTANNGETTWEYQVVESGATLAETGDATSNNPLSLTGLTAYTAYDVYVRANCGDSVSGWVMESFTTLFQAPSCGETAEYCYANGDGGGFGFDGSYTVDPLELVFTSTVDTTGDYLTLTIGGETESNYDWVYVTDGAGNVILEPVSGAMEYDVVSEDGTVNVYISADGSASCASPSSWSGEPDTPLSFTVSCNPPPSCIDPTDLTVSNITTTTASVSWTANSGESAWEYQVVESGVAPNATGDATSDNPLALTDLTDNTTYDVYVRANCDADGTSEWVTVSFTTLPAPIVPDYMNDFTTFPGEFWSEGLGALNVGPTGSTSSWMEDGFVSGSTGAAVINLYALKDSWLISPMFDLSNGTFFLNVDAAATEYNTQSTDAIFGADDFVTLMASTDGGSTWVELHRWDASNNPGYTGTGWTEITLNNYTTTSKFAIYGESTNSAEDVDFFVDNFSITSTSLGLEDVNTTSNFTYFPNPVNNVLSIKAQASIDSITVYNMLGQTVVRSTPNTTTTAVDMSGLQTGAYFVQVAINNSIETVRVIKN